MAHHKTNDDTDRESQDGEVGCRGHRLDPAASWPSRAFGYLTGLVRSMADTKLRRMRNELTLRGIRLDGPEDEWIPSSLREASYSKSEETSR